jgi:lysozyme
MNDLKISESGLDFIARWEGIVLHPYMDVAGLWTIGVGHLIKSTDSFGTITNAQIKELLSSKDKAHPVAGIYISREEALKILSKDVEEVEKALRSAIKVPLNQKQFDALASFGFNCGVNVFKTSGACKALNNGDYSSVAEKLLAWSKVRIGGVLQTNKGLYSRRVSEGNLFNQEVFVDRDDEILLQWSQDLLKETQEKLKKLGLYPGLLDGIFGPATKRGIEAFEKLHGIGAGSDKKYGITNEFLSKLRAS